MTYRAFVGGSINGPFDNEKYGFPQSYMMLDIAALQEMYGANYTHNSGDTIYTFSRATGEMFIDGIGQGRPGANRIFLTIWDGDGEDTYDFSNYHSNLVIRLDPGSWSLTSKAQLALLDQGTHHYARANVFNALLHNDDTRSLIENVIGGSGRDRLIGNQADNELTGNGRGDKISGRDGADHLFGGRGIDTLWGGVDADVFVFTALFESRVGKYRDVIKDFSTLQGDQIDLTALEDATATSFHFISASNFSGPGDMRYVSNVLSIDVDGDGRSDFQIKVAGLQSEADFILNP
jgi:serralysin